MGGDALRAALPGAGGPDRRQDRLRHPHRGRQHAARARRRPRPGRPHPLCRRERARRDAEGAATWCWSARASRSRSSPIPDKPSLLMPKDAKSTKLAGRRGRHRGGARSAGHRARRHRRAAGRRRGAAPARAADGRRSRRRQSPPSSAPCCPRTPSSSTRASRRAASSSPRRPAPRRTTGSTTSAARSATACRSPIGAAIACPDRKVIALDGDGSAMYTLQALWTMAREGLDVTALIFANRTYKILRGELTNVGVRNPGPRAVDMLSLDRPDLDWVSLARGMGVEASRAQDLRAADQGPQRRPQVAGALPGRGAPVAPPVMPAEGVSPRAGTQRPRHLPHNCRRLASRRACSRSFRQRCGVGPTSAAFSILGLRLYVEAIS